MPRQANAAPAPPAVAKTIAADVAAYQAANKTPGVVVAVYDPKQFGTNGAVYAFGVTSFRGTKKADANTVFQIGSITKVFDGTLLGDEIARGYASASTTAYNAMKSPKSLAKATPMRTALAAAFVAATACIAQTIKYAGGYVIVHFCAQAFGAGGGCADGGDYRSRDGEHHWQFTGMTGNWDPLPS